MKRTLLLLVLAIEGVGGLIGGALLMAAPDGAYMEMSTSVLNNVFPDFFIPGMVLFCLGILSIIAFFGVWLRVKFDWFLVGCALFGYVIWFGVEILVIRELHWLQVVWGVPVILGIWAAMPLVPKRELKV